MRRRTLLKSAIALGAAVPAAGLFEGVAQASQAYGVAVCEQYRNQVQIHTSNGSWATPSWAFSPGGGAWANLSDVKFRSTAHYGEVAVVAASGGNVGIVDKSAGGTQGTGSLVWHATPGSNPHAVERIPDKGAIVAASSGGYLHVYAPSNVNNAGTLALVQTISYPAAHGVWWDDVHSQLWTVGQGKASVWTVSGSNRAIRLVHHADIGFGSTNTGHSLDASYADSSIVLVSHSSAVIAISKSTHAIRTVHANKAVKSFSQHSSGEAFWVQATGTKYHGDSRNWVNPAVQFFTPAGAKAYTRGLSYGAEFYKARLHNVNFH